MADKDTYLYAAHNGLDAVQILLSRILTAIEEERYTDAAYTWSQVTDVLGEPLGRTVVALAYHYDTDNFIALLEREQ